MGGCAELGPIEKKVHFGKDEIAGGFALFDLGRDTGSFTVFDSDAKPLSEGAVRLYRLTTSNSTAGQVASLWREPVANWHKVSSTLPLLKG